MTATDGSLRGLSQPTRSDVDAIVNGGAQANPQEGRWSPADASVNGGAEASPPRIVLAEWSPEQ